MFCEQEGGKKRGGKVLGRYCYPVEDGARSSSETSGGGEKKKSSHCTLE